MMRVRQAFEALIVGVGIVLFWRGIWGIADQYMLPGYPVASYTVSVICGSLLLVASRHFIDQFIDNEIEEHND